MGRILIVDDEASICWAFRESLADEGHEVAIASSAEEGLRAADAGGFDAVVLDVRLPGMDGLQAIRPFRDRIGAAPIIIITAFGNLETAVRAMEGGAFDYLIKPFDLDRAIAAVKRALDAGPPRDPNPGADAVAGPDQLIGSSPAMQDLFVKIALVAPTDVPVLVTGESGTGKELVARAIHRHSTRRDGPFLPICLAALNPNLVEAEVFGHVKGSFTGATQDRKGLLELAAGGTVLLDEVGDIPALLQVKLLRAIEQREVTPVGDARPRATNLRLIAATNRPLADLIAAGQFRADLFFRLGVFPIQIPPLRDRKEDIPTLAEHFLRSFRPAAAPGDLSADCRAALLARAWTGNARELRNAIEHAAIVARGGPLRAEHLPPAVALPVAPQAPGVPGLDDGLAAWARQEARRSDPQSPLHERFLATFEPPLLRAALEACNGNRAAAAQLLGMHRATLREKLRRYAIE